MAQLEPRGQRLAEAADAECLCGVVPGADQMDPALARGGHRALGEFAGEQRIGAGDGGVGDVVGPGAGHDRQPAHERRTGVEQERLAVGDGGDAGEQLGGGQAGAGGIPRRGRAARVLAVLVGLGRFVAGEPVGGPVEPSVAMKPIGWPRCSANGVRCSAPSSAPSACASRALLPS